MIDAALRWAMRAHKGQVNHITGEPYIMHVVRVAGRMRTEREMVVAMLHDICEDTLVEPADIGHKFGDEIQRSVELLTRARVRSVQTADEIDHNYMAYVDRIAESGDAVAVVVKLADIEDHLAIGHLSEEQRARVKITRYLAARARLEHA